MNHHYGCDCETCSWEVAQQWEAHEAERLHHLELEEERLHEKVQEQAAIASILRTAKESNHD